MFSYEFFEIFKDIYFVERLHAITVLHHYYILFIIFWVNKKKRFQYHFFHVESVIHMLFFRSSRSQMFYKTGVLKTFAEDAGNTCAKVSVLIKLQDSRLELL